MLEILLYLFRLIFIYYFGDDSVFGLNTYYMNESVHEEFNIGAQLIFTGVTITYLFVEFYIMKYNLL